MFIREDNHEADREADLLIEEAVPLRAENSRTCHRLANAEPYLAAMSYTIKLSIHNVILMRKGRRIPVKKAIPEHAQGSGNISPTNLPRPLPQGVQYADSTIIAGQRSDCCHKTVTESSILESGSRLYRCKTAYGSTYSWLFAQ